MLVYLGTTDITKHIVADSYAVDSEAVYKAWEDANGRNHREQIRSRVKGSFSVICSEKTGLKAADFLDLISDNKTNNELTITLYVNNENELQSINCFYSIKTKTHTDLVDIYEVTVEEC